MAAERKRLAELDWDLERRSDAAEPHSSVTRPEAEASAKLSPAAEKVAKFAKAVFKQHAAELKALGHESELTIGETTSKSGIETTAEGRIVVDPEKLARDTEKLTAKQAIKKIKRAMAEEVFHAGTIKWATADDIANPAERAQASAERIQKLKALSKDPEWNEIGRKIYGEEWDTANGGKGLNDFQKSAEIARIISQGKAGRLTESAWQKARDYFAGVLRYLRTKIKNLSPESREVIRGIEERLGKFEEGKPASENTKDGTPTDVLPNTEALGAASTPDEFKDDKKNQRSWMESEARNRGFENAPDLARKDPSQFKVMLAQWRACHPRDERGMALQNKGVKTINKLLYGSKNKASPTLAGARETLRDAAENVGGSEQTGRSPSEQKNALRKYAEESGIAVKRLPRRFELRSDNDKGKSEHHAWGDPDSGRWLGCQRGQF